jgi:peptide/nickel transport system permease protein
MSRFIARRLLSIIPLLIAVSLVVFAMSKALPGDPVEIFLQQADIANPELVNAMKDKYGLNDPLPVQYWTWLSLMFQGDMGESIRRGEAVSDLLFRGMRNTFSVATASVLLVIVVGWTMGVLSAVVHNRAWPQVITRFLAQVPVLMLSIPGFAVAVFMVLIFGISLGWLPTSGVSNPRAGADDLIDLGKHLILPTIGLALASVGGNWRLARNTMIEVLREDYIRMAHAKGLPLWRVYFLHGLRTTLVPLLTSAGLLFGSLLTGSFILEYIFAWPGIGLLLVESTVNRDVPVVMGATILIASMYIFLNLAVDILYAIVDPRVRYA